jgi:hypothetical protein
MPNFGALFALVLFLIAPLPSISAQSSSTFDWVAFHRTEDLIWSQKTGLSPKEIRNLRLAVGIADNEPSNPLDAIDARTLPNERIFLTTVSGSGHCLNVNVLHRHGKGFQKLWSAGAMPDGSGFCHPPACRNVGALATSKNQVMIAVPVQLAGAPVGACDENTVLTYRGKGKTYRLTETHHWPARCDLDDYQIAVHMAIADAKNFAPDKTEQVVAVHIFSSFSPESAIVFDKTANGLAITHLTFSRKVHSQLNVLAQSQTPSQCIAQAKSIPIDRTPVNISSTDAQRLLDGLNKIDLNVNSCPRHADGTCVYFERGTAYTVVLEDGRLLHLWNVSALENVTSENPALLQWVTTLRELVKAQEQHPLL